MHACLYMIWHENLNRKERKKNVLKSNAAEMFMLSTKLTVACWCFQQQSRNRLLFCVLCITWPTKNMFVLSYLCDMEIRQKKNTYTRTDSWTNLSVARYNSISRKQISPCLLIFQYFNTNLSPKWPIEPTAVQAWVFSTSFLLSVMELSTLSNASANISIFNASCRPIGILNAHRKQKHLNKTQIVFAHVHSLKWPSFYLLILPLNSSSYSLHFQHYNANWNNVICFTFHPLLLNDYRSILWHFFSFLHSSMAKN